MHFYPFILVSVFAAAATTALPLHNNSPTGISPRQDSSCAAAKSSEEAARKKLYAAKSAFVNSSSSNAKQAQVQLAMSRQEYALARSDVVSVVILLELEDAYKAKTK
ncbi:hypothetical protein N7494_003355 [Penicillium frequentans]|uniref:Uncharacterized protein n=1 Tax=Penicillium frequentans TaxID=3151616 RepID=A0AAD6CYL2_9EURO|nr:hypothetical protein N7494_003355 [Penicillium glabrum]